MSRASRPLCGTRPVAPSAHDAAAPFPVAVFPAPLRQFIHEVAAALPCPADFVGVPMLALLGCAIGTSRVLRVKPGWLEGPRLYTAVVADTGTKKSPALRFAAQPYYDRQRTLLQQYLDAHDLETAGYTVAMDTRPGPPPVPRARQPPPMATLPADDRPSPPQLFTTDTTLEALLVLVAQIPRGIALIQDELGAWTRAMDQYRKRGADRQRWLSLWNGAPVIVNRKSRQQPIVLDNPLVCIAGCIAQDTLDELSDARGRDDGFIHRILFAYPDPMPVRWTEAAVSDQTLQGYTDVYEALWSLQGDLKQAGSGPPFPLELGFTAKGRAAFIAFAEALYAELTDPALPDYLRGPWSKYDGGAGARLALIVHLCRVMTGEADSEAVDAHSVRAAIALVDYFKAHARRVYQRLRATRADQRAETAIRWIQAHGNVCTIRDLQRHRVAGVTRASQAEKLLRDLIDLGAGELREHRLPSGRLQRVLVMHRQTPS
jgi:hypothetical protein